MRDELVALFAKDTIREFDELRESVKVLKQFINSYGNPREVFVPVQDRFLLERRITSLLMRRDMRFHSKKETTEAVRALDARKPARQAGDSPTPWTRAGRKVSEMRLLMIAGLGLPGPHRVDPRPSYLMFVGPLLGLAFLAVSAAAFEANYQGRPLRTSSDTGLLTWTCRAAYAANTGYYRSSGWTVVSEYKKESRPATWIITTTRTIQRA
jgi:hypothetical protein